MKIDKFIAFYKRYISPLFPPACRFYPTCSEYAALCFRFENPAIALFKSIARILKCNQLFKGGIAYPQITLDSAKFLRQRTQIPQISTQNPQNIAFWLVPAHKIKPNQNAQNPKNNAKITQKFYAIKSLKKDKH